MILALTAGGVTTFPCVEYLDPISRVKVVKETPPPLGATLPEAPNRFESVQLEAYTRGRTPGLSLKTIIIGTTP